jgi:hypothetical protein
VLFRAVDRGLVAADTDVATIADGFPAIAYQRVAAQGLPSSKPTSCVSSTGSCFRHWPR